RVRFPAWRAADTMELSLQAILRPRDLAMSSFAVTHRLVFSGRVQGVGFRYTVRSIAKHHPIVGYVRNLPDGTVELVARGASDAIDKLLTEVSLRFRANITGVERKSDCAEEM